MTITDRYALPLEEARKALEHQQRDINSLRDRAGNLLQFAALAAGFIGALSLRDGESVTNWTRAAVWAFAVLAFLLISVLWPRRFTFTNRPEVLLQKEWDKEPDDFAQDLAGWLAKHFETNKSKVDWMYRAYTGAIVVLGFEVLFLLIDLLGR